MANVNLSQRTYTKLVSVSDGASLEVSCCDTLGNLIKCNYVAATFNPSASTSFGTVIISPLVGSINSPSAIGASNLSATNSTSGALGFSLASRNGTIPSPGYEYLCLPGESFTKIQILGLLGGSGGVVNLTYGVVQEFNAIKAKDRYTYDLGR